MGFNADKKIFVKVFDIYEKNPKKAIYLKSIIQYFPSEIIASAATTLMLSIKDDYKSNDDQLVIIREMGVSFLRTPPKK